MKPAAVMTTQANTIGSSNMKRWIVPAALVSAAAWIASGLFHYAFVYPEPGAGSLGSMSSYLIEAAHAVAEGGIMVVLLGLLANPIFRLGRLGLAGLGLSLLGTILLVFATLLVIIFLDRPGEVLLTALFGTGLIATLLGFPTYGIAAFRARPPLRWLGILMLSYPFLFIAMMASYGAGGIALGVAWAAIAYVMHQHVRAAGASAHASPSEPQFTPRNL